jgi:TRAP-type C4-dicarboxylate transport system substrate-binding protein
MVASLNRWADSFNAAAKGEYKMEVFPGGTLAGMNDTIDVVRTGAVEMGHGTIPGYGGNDPRFLATQLPFALNNMDANNVFCDLSQDLYNEILETRFNQKLMTSYCGGMADLYTTDRKVETLEDWKGLMIACVDSMSAETAEAMGASAVYMDWPDEYPSLEKGVVNGGFISQPSGFAFVKYYEVCDYFMLAGRAGSQFCLTMNLDIFNSLPDNLQEVMIEEGNKHTEEMMPFFIDWINGWCMDTIREGGTEFVYIPSEERARWAEQCAPLYEKYWNKVGKTAATMLQDYIAQANAAYPYEY